MIPARRVACADEIAAMLGCKPRAFHARRARLVAAGFPPPLPGLGWRWDIQAVEAWISAQSGAPGAADPGGIEARLIERAAAMAAA
jgi:hypothetical protein